MTTVDPALARSRMVHGQLKERGIRDPRVLSAMATVPREEFVPEEARNRAYEDHPLPIGRGQTISQPYIVARMLELAQLQGHERVLEIGAGSGYQTALLSLLATEVCGLELEGELLVQAANRLRKLKLTKGVDLREGSGRDPWPGGGDFDVILCACAPASLPEVLAAQLRCGGRLILPVGPENTVQSLRCLRKAEDGGLIEECSDPVRFVPMR